MPKLVLEDDEETLLDGSVNIRKKTGKIETDEYVKNIMEDSRNEKITKFIYGTDNNIIIGLYTGYISVTDSLFVIIFNTISGIFNGSIYVANFFFNTIYKIFELFSSGVIGIANVIKIVVSDIYRMIFGGQINVSNESREKIEQLIDETKKVKTNKIEDNYVLVFMLLLIVILLSNM